MRLFLAFGLALLASAPAPQAQDDRGLEEALRSVSARDIREDVFWLADPAREGRESGTEHGHEAALYLANLYEMAGLEPGGLEGTYFQSFGENGDIQWALRRAPPEDANFLEIEGRRNEPCRLPLGPDYRPLDASPDGDVTGTLIYVAPAAAMGSNVRRAIVVRETGGTDGEAWARDAQLIAGAGAAAAVLVVPGSVPSEQIPTQVDPTLTIPAVLIPREALNRMLEARGRDAGHPDGFRVREAHLMVRRRGPVAVGYKNVVARRPGADEALRDRYIVIGAHYDHVGHGLWGSRGTRGQIHPGADDNGSGTSALLAIARALGRTQFRRSVVLISFDAEERGLWGSQAFANGPTWPLAQCDGMVNMDMIGRGDLTHLCVGRALAPGTGVDFARMDAAIATAQERFRVTFDMTGADEYVQRSDQWNFATKGVLAIFLFGGMHEDYHTERDTPDKINLPKVEAVARVALLIAAELANAPAPTDAAQPPPDDAAPPAPPPPGSTTP